MDYEAMPCVFPAEPFEVNVLASALRDAMKGFGTDEETILDILTCCSNCQRQKLIIFYNNEHERDLMDDLKTELGGRFEDVIVGLMLPPTEYLCTELHKAMSGIGTNESVLVEILCTRSQEEMAEIVVSYEAMYDRPLAEQMCSETSSHFRRLLTLIVTGVRDPVGSVNEEEAMEMADALFDAGNSKLGTDEEVFNRIFAHNSFAQLRLIFEAYKDLAGRSIEQAIEDEMSGEMHEAMLAIGKCK